MDNFEEIYSKYFYEVYRFILSLCRDKHTAEEITQETFFKALKKSDGFNEKCSLKTWLCKIAKNTYLDYIKRNKHLSDLIQDTISDNTNIEDSLLHKETAYDIHKILHKLNEPYKEVFWLRTFGELSFLKIGDLFNKSETWARTTYYRAKLKIKEELI